MELKLPQIYLNFEEEEILNTGHLLILKTGRNENQSDFTMNLDLDFGLIFIMAIVITFGMSHITMLCKLIIRQNIKNRSPPTFSSLKMR